MNYQKKLLQIAHDNDPFSVTGWGAIEKLAREYHSALGEYFDVYTVSSGEAHLDIIKQFKPDYILIHNEKFAVELLKHKHEIKSKILVICHYAYLKEVFKINQYNVLSRELNTLFGLRNALNILRVRKRIMKILSSEFVTFIALDNAILEKRSHDVFIKVGRNYIKENHIEVVNNTNNRYVCVGNIEPRKRQWKLQRLSTRIDFIGPLNDSRFDPRKNYLGEIDNSKIMSVVKQYDALILMSEADLMPLVVIEALFVGVPVILHASFYGPFSGCYGVVPIEDFCEIESTDIQCFDRNHIARESKKMFSLDQKHNQLALVKLLTE